MDVTRFKGLGEMMAAQLKETTMDPGRAHVAARCWRKRNASRPKSVERLMGNKAEARFEFIQENAQFASADLLDV